MRWTGERGRRLRADPKLTSIMHSPSPAFCGVLQAGLYVFVDDAWIVEPNIGIAPTIDEKSNDELDRQPRPADHGLANEDLRIALNSRVSSHQRSNRARREGVSGDPTWYVGLPSADHPINAKLGRYFAAASYMEFSILLCMAAARGEGANVDNAFAALTSKTTISEKIKELDCVSQSSTAINEYKRSVISAACKHLEALNRTRNRYAHGLFEHNRDGTVRIRPYGLRNKPDNGPYVLKAARIEGDITLLDAMLRTAQYVAGMITREQLQRHLDKLTNAKRDVW
jgi:hypothetical protein